MLKDASLTIDGHKSPNDSFQKKYFKSDVTHFRSDVTRGRNNKCYVTLACYVTFAQDMTYLHPLYVLDNIITMG